MTNPAAFDPIATAVGLLGAARIAHAEDTVEAHSFLTRWVTSLSHAEALGTVEALLSIQLATAGDVDRLFDTLRRVALDSPP